MIHVSLNFARQEELQNPDTTSIAGLKFYIILIRCRNILISKLRTAGSYQHTNHINILHKFSLVQNGLKMEKYCNQKMAPLISNCQITLYILESLVHAL